MRIVQRRSGAATLLACAMILLWIRPVFSYGPNRIIIPGIALDTRIEAVGTSIVYLDNRAYRKWNVSKDHVGWHNTTVRPGQAGNMVLAGHSDINSRIFRDLHHVRVGYEIVVTDHNQTVVYVVGEIREVQEVGVSTEQRIQNAQAIRPTSDGRARVTLVTCSRPNATHRLIVIAYAEKVS